VKVNAVAASQGLEQAKGREWKPLIVQGAAAETLSQQERQAVDNSEKVVRSPETAEVQRTAAEVQRAVEEMNRVLSVMDTDIEFEVHEKTHCLMVKVIDQRTKEVIKEIPSRKFLDTVAVIREYVGILLDEQI
jgi:flagellar protein FlaG